METILTMIDNGTIQSTKVEEAVYDILDEKFVKSEEVASILYLAIISNKNALIFGPPGYGKSEMVKHATDRMFGRHYCSNECQTHFEQHGTPCNACDDPGCCKRRTFIQSFGEGMTEDRQFGGLDWKAFNEQNLQQFHVERSFLNYECAVFEEIFDAPPIVLMSLKDTLAAKELRNGEQRFPMKTRTIIGLTNKEPNEISDLGPSAHALIERFPLQLNLKWDEYGEKDFHQLFNKVLEQEYKKTKSAIKSEKDAEVKGRMKDGLEKLISQDKDILEKLSGICAVACDKAGLSIYFTQNRCACS